MKSRTKGRSKKGIDILKLGKQCIAATSSQRGKIVSLNSSKSKDVGIMHTQIIDCTCNSDIFCQFFLDLRDELKSITVDKPFCSIMDNCRIHHTDDVKRLLEEKDVYLKFLPPYLPFLNIIEQSFSTIKFTVRKENANIDYEAVLSRSTELNTGVVNARIELFKEVIAYSLTSITIEKCESYYNCIFHHISDCILRKDFNI